MARGVELICQMALIENSIPWPSVLELYWDAEPILSQALWGSPDRGGIYNN